MPRYLEQVFENQTVELDGSEFERCTFRNCILRYSGGQHFVIDDGNMQGCRLELAGCAANTIAALGPLLNTPLRNSVKGQLPKSLIDLIKEQS